MPFVEVRGSPPVDAASVAAAGNPHTHSHSVPHRHRRFCDLDHGTACGRPLNYLTLAPPPGRTGPSGLARANCEPGHAARRTCGRFNRWKMDGGATAAAGPPRHVKQIFFQAREGHNHDTNLLGGRGPGVDSDCLGRLPCHGRPRRGRRLPSVQRGRRVRHALSPAIAGRVPPRCTLAKLRPAPTAVVA